MAERTTGLSERTGGLTRVEYVGNVVGARSYPLSRAKAFRFDAGANKVKYMSAIDAEMLVKKYGPNTFKLDSAT